MLGSSASQSEGRAAGFIRLAKEACEIRLWEGRLPVANLLSKYQKIQRATQQASPRPRPSRLAPRSVGELTVGVCAFQAIWSTSTTPLMSEIAFAASSLAGSLGRSRCFHRLLFVRDLSRGIAAAHSLAQQSNDRNGKREYGENASDDPDHDSFSCSFGLLPRDYVDDSDSDLARAAARGAGSKDFA